MPTDTKVKERPIIFNSEMIRAILSGAKTQTRRVIKPQPVASKTSDFAPDTVKIEARYGHMVAVPYTRGPRMLWNEGPKIKCPFGKPGDRLWCRETWAYVWAGYGETNAVVYKDCIANTDVLQDFPYPRAATDEMGMPIKWRSPLFMPRWTHGRM